MFETPEEGAHLGFEEDLVHISMLCLEKQGFEQIEVLKHEGHELGAFMRLEILVTLAALSIEPGKIGAPGQGTVDSGRHGYPLLEVRSPSCPGAASNLDRQVRKRYDNSNPTHEIADISQPFESLSHSPPPNI